MHLQSTLGAFLVAFTMAHGTPILPENDQNSRGITAPFKHQDNLPKHLDNLPNKYTGNLPNMDNQPVRPVGTFKDPDQKYPTRPRVGTLINDLKKPVPKEGEKNLQLAGAKGGAPAPPVKRSPGRSSSGGSRGWKGKDIDPETKPSRSDRKGENPDKQDGIPSSGYKDTDESANRDAYKAAYKSGGERYKDPVSDADKKKNFDDFKEKPQTEPSRSDTKGPDSDSKGGNPDRKGGNPDRKGGNPDKQDRIPSTGYEATDGSANRAAWQAAYKAGNEKPPGKVWGEAKAGGPRGDGRPDGGRAGAAPPVKRSPRRGSGRGSVGRKGKPELDQQTKPAGSDRKGPNPDRKDRGPDKKGPDSDRKGGHQDNQGQDSNGIRDGITDGIHDGFSTGFEYAADEFANQAAASENEKRKVPVSVSNKKKEKFDDLKEKLDRMDDKDFKPSWRVKNPCGGPACIQSPYDNPLRNIDNTLPYAGVPQ